MIRRRHEPTRSVHLQRLPNWALHFDHHRIVIMDIAPIAFHPHQEVAPPALIDIAQHRWRDLSLYRDTCQKPRCTAKRRDVAKME